MNSGEDQAVLSPPLARQCPPRFLLCSTIHAARRSLGVEQINTSKVGHSHEVFRRRPGHARGLLVCSQIRLPAASCYACLSHSLSTRRLAIVCLRGCTSEHFALVGERLRSPRQPLAPLGLGRGALRRHLGNFLSLEGQLASAESPPILMLDDELVTIGGGAKKGEVGGG